MDHLTRLAHKFKNTLNKTANKHNELELLLKKSLDGDAETYQVFLDLFEETYPDDRYLLNNKHIFGILGSLSKFFLKIINEETFHHFKFYPPFLGKLEKISDLIGLHMKDYSCSIPTAGERIRFSSITIWDNRPIINNQEVTFIDHVNDNYSFKNADGIRIPVTMAVTKDATLYNKYMEDAIACFEKLRSIFVQ